MTVEQPPKLVVTSIASGAATSGAIDMRHWVMGMVLVPSAWTAANIGFQVCDTEDGTFVAVKDDTGTPVQISSVTTDASFWYQFPSPDLFAGYFVKLWSKSTTAATVTDTNQGAARALKVLLK